MDSFPDSSPDVLNELDPLSRALLDLSIQREMDDSEIAQVLGTDEQSVLEVRTGLLRNLAEQVAPEHAQDDLPELQAAVAAQLYEEEAPESDEATGEEDETAVEADEPGDEVDEAELEETAVETEPEAAEPGAAAAPEPTAEPEPRRRRTLLVVLLPLLLLAAIAGLVVALTSGGDDDNGADTGRAPAERPRLDAPRAGDSTPPVRLTALGSTNATGTARRNGNRVTLTVSNLPPERGGTYTVWLYDSIIDAKRLKAMKGNRVTIRLPADTSDYRFLDVSLEPRDGNANHSGRSILRTTLRKLQS